VQKKRIQELVNQKEVAENCSERGNDAAAAPRYATRATPRAVYSAQRKPPRFFAALPL